MTPSDSAPASSAVDLDAQVGQPLAPPPPARSVLVTGGAGFIGSFLVRKLARLYPHWRLTVVDKLDYCSSLRSLNGLLAPGSKVEFVQADITDAPRMHALLAANQIDTVVHLAAQTHVDNSFGNSLAFTQANVLGTHVLLEAARARGSALLRFVHVSTDEVYGDICTSAPNAHESSLLAPTNPYAATKAAAECLVLAYHRTYGLPAVITRSNNVYGPAQYPEKLVPKFICQLLAGRKCTLHGDGTNTRRYLYVSDVCDALDLILQRGETGEIYNIGTDVELANRTLASLLVRHFHPNCTDPLRDHVEQVPDRALNDRRYAIDSTKLRKLGWAPRIEFADGLKRTVDWYQLHRNEWWGDIEGALQAHPDTVPRTQ